MGPWIEADARTTASLERTLVEAQEIAKAELGIDDDSELPVDVRFAEDVAQCVLRDLPSERTRRGEQAEAHAARVIGVAVGEVMVRVHGYRWGFVGDDWGDVLAVRHESSGTIAFPIDAAAKRLDEPNASFVRGLVGALAPRTTNGRKKPRGEACPFCSFARDELTIFEDARWRLRHADPAGAAGWLLLVSKRHVRSLAELDAAEQAELGPLLARVEDALRRTTGAERVYVAMVPETFAHFHAHLVPRGPDVPRERRGFPIFAELREVAAGDAAPPERRAVEKLVRELRRLIA